MLVNCERNRGEFDGIVIKDGCNVRHWGLDYFDNVIDIGANIGVFSVMMRMLHPHAKILAVEPSPINIEFLKSNVDYLDIIVDERGLGDGSVMYHQFGRKNHPVTDYFIPVRNEDSISSIRTEPFWKLFMDNGCGVDKLFVKIDCEGSEQYLVGDRKSEEILLVADQVFMEVHFRAEKNIWRTDNYIAEFELFEEWVNDVFSKTHNIDLCLARKKGHGQYCIRKEGQL